jgi:hypothetical protein
MSRNSRYVFKDPTLAAAAAAEARAAKQRPEEGVDRVHAGLSRRAKTRYPARRKSQWI